MKVKFLKLLSSWVKIGNKDEHEMVSFHRDIFSDLCISINDMKKEGVSNEVTKYDKWQ